ncbi:unnamed protein product [Withania somnifera]
MQLKQVRLQNLKLNDNKTHLTLRESFSKSRKYNMRTYYMRIKKTEFGCWCDEFKLDSNIWCGSSVSCLVNVALVPTFGFFDDLSPSQLFTGEISRQPESGVRGSCCDEND